MSAQLSQSGKIRVTPRSDALEVSCMAADGRHTVLSIATDSIVAVSEPEAHSVDYQMPLGKKRHCQNRYVECRYTMADGSRIVVRVYDDGIAWAGLPVSTISIPSVKHSWLMNWSDAYEGFYEADRTDLKVGSRISYPALFQFADSLFMLLTESDIDSQNAASSIYTTDRPYIFELKPDGAESPGWQTAIIGSLAEVVESTLITDNSRPCKLDDIDWIHPGVASWVYWAYNDGSRDYDIVKRYIDFAARLSLPYVLIDADWHLMNGDHQVEDAISYALSLGVKPMIWYNSSIGWIDGAPGPKFRLNTLRDMEREFAWCREQGIAGVKVDFFSGDTNENISMMWDILECAARHRLLVNFHGATLPRGWQRTFPNLVSTEAVYGAEWYNNGPTLTARAARHNATLPFTRNVVGSMDYTPCAFSDSQNPHITSDAHELALTVVFESGIQHLADRPESILAQPDEVISFLSRLPAAWDETLLLGGYPGEYAVLARRAADRWYVAGINGNDAPKTVALDFSRLKLPESVQIKLFADGESGWDITAPTSLPESITLRARGGFIFEISPR